MTIIRGTTPTIKYTFKTIHGTDITVARFTVSQAGTVLVDKDLADAVVDSTSISWTMTQVETLKLDTDIPAKLMLNWKVADGTRGASKITIASIRENDVSEVI